MIKIQTLIARIIAVFGVELWKAAAIAGFMAAGKVTEALLRAWSEDGTLTKEEVAAAFGKKG